MEGARRRLSPSRRLSDVLRSCQVLSIVGCSARIVTRRATRFVGRSLTLVPSACAPPLRRPAPCPSQLLGRLDTDHADDNFSGLGGSTSGNWKDVAVALAAIDRSLGIDMDEVDPDSIMADASGKQAGATKSMWRVWRKWTIDNHTFNSVKVSESEARMLSEGLLSQVEADEDGSVVLPTIKYSFPPVPKKVRRARAPPAACAPILTHPDALSRIPRARSQNLTPKPLTSDQKAQNRIFLRQCTRHWRDAQRQMRVELGQYLTDAEARIRKAREKQKSKGSGAVRLPSREQLQSAGLYAIGLKRLHKWAEDDDEMIKEQKRKEKAEQQQEGKQAHDGYVRDKDRKRIRLPLETAGVSRERPPRFDFSLGKVRAHGGRAPACAPTTDIDIPRARARAKGLNRNCKTSVVSSTVDLMRSSGLKYVHALNLGRMGMDGDLEKCRQQLLDEGFVHAGNFDLEDPDSVMNRGKYDELRGKAAAAKLTKRERQHDAEQAYSAWVQQKQWQEQALQCLEAIDMPVDVQSSSFAHWKRVGRALKAVDSTLLREWIRWSKGLPEVTPKVCSVLWDKFPPVGCDVHRGTSSSVRDVLLKLLRPGIDYASAFQRLCDRKWLKHQAEAEEPPSAADRAEYEEVLVVTRKDMHAVLRDAGLVLQPDEVGSCCGPRRSPSLLTPNSALPAQVRRVVDALDRDGLGGVQLQRLREFTGDRRPVFRGDAWLHLRDLCVWSTTCHSCGMANSCRVTVAPAHADGKDVVQLTNGEKRQRVHLPEHRQRDDILRQFGEHCGCLDAEHDADDEYADDDQGGVFSRWYPLRPPVKCEAAQWSRAQRLEGLRVLQELSQARAMLSRVATVVYSCA